jgi:predicted nucleic acid-binding protein
MFPRSSVGALHLACAEAAGADYFCTCDDRFLKKAQTLKDSQMMAIVLVSFIG